jgi:WhiB family redox-sensing transcriptional regulator
MDLLRMLQVLNEDWRQDAVCRNLDPELFAPLPGSADEAKARAVCWTCPVRRTCLDEALAEADTTTVRGGYTPDERRALMRERLEITA